MCRFDIGGALISLLVHEQRVQMLSEIVASVLSAAEDVNRCPISAGADVETLLEDFALFVRPAHPGTDLSDAQWKVLIEKVSPDGIFPILIADGKADPFWSEQFSEAASELFEDDEFEVPELDLVQWRLNLAASLERMAFSLR